MNFLRNLFLLLVLGGMVYGLLWYSKQSQEKQAEKEEVLQEEGPVNDWQYDKAEIESEGESEKPENGDKFVINEKHHKLREAARKLIQEKLDVNRQEVEEIVEKFKRESDARFRNLTNELRESIQVTYDDYIITLASDHPRLSVPERRPFDPRSYDLSIAQSGRFDRETYNFIMKFYQMQKKHDIEFINSVDKIKKFYLPHLKTIKEELDSANETAKSKKLKKEIRLAGSSYHGFFRALDMPYPFDFHLVKGL